MNIHNILTWWEHLNWWLVGPAIVGYLNIVIAGTRAMGWMRLASFCEKIENAIQAMINAAFKNKSGRPVEEPPR